MPDLNGLLVPDDFLKIGLSLNSFDEQEIRDGIEINDLDDVEDVMAGFQMAELSDDLIDDRDNAALLNGPPSFTETLFRILVFMATNSSDTNETQTSRTRNDRFRIRESSARHLCPVSVSNTRDWRLPRYLP